MLYLKHLSSILNIFFLSFILILSCANAKKEKTQMNYNESELIQLSPLTQIFLREFDKEFSKFNKTDNFIPSKNLTEKYSIINKDNQFYISGLIKIEDFAGDVDLPDLIVHTKAGNILTVMIPLNQFYNIIVNKNIKYLQIDEKVHRK